MQIFLDSADVGQVQSWLRTGIVDGVTTNPTILLKCGVTDMEQGIRQLAELLGDRPLSVEVTTDRFEEMLTQGRLFASWARNIVVKIPVINQFGEPSLEVIAALAAEQIRVNATAALSLGQAVLAAKAGAAYVSLFAGRIADEGHDPVPIIRTFVEWIDRWQSPVQLIVGSLRQSYDVMQAMATGAHILTVPPELLRKVMDHQYSRATAKQFVQDAKQAEASMQAKLPV